MDRGFTRVRPLAGGLDEWVREGFPVEVAEADPDSSSGPGADLGRSTA
jgi:3-mercaptopyruvate sulfurtransferase SseA